jgi:hypothetical protein
MGAAKPYAILTLALSADAHLSSHAPVLVSDHVLKKLNVVVITWQSETLTLNRPQLCQTMLCRFLSRRDRPVGQLEPALAGHYSYQTLK